MVGELVNLVKKSRTSETQAPSFSLEDTQKTAIRDIHIELTEEQRDSILSQWELIDPDETAHITFYLGERTVGALTTDDIHIWE